MHRGREFQGVEKGSIGKRWVNKNSKDLLKISYNFLRGKLQPEIFFFKKCIVFFLEKIVFSLIVDKRKTTKNQTSPVPP